MTDSTRGPSGQGVPDWRISAQWAARARWITHLCDFLGDPSNEWSPHPEMALRDRPEFLVLAFPPTPSRAYWTYATAGLSFVAQRSSGERNTMPHVELMAYSPHGDPRVAEFLFMLAYDIAWGEADEMPFRAWDLWRASRHGMEDFALLPALEADELLDFPNPRKREEDARYLLAATGELNGSMELNVLQLLPLTKEEWQFASENGSYALLERLGPDLPVPYGWDPLGATAPRS